VVVAALILTNRGRQIQVWSGANGMDYEKTKLARGSIVTFLGADKDPKVLETTPMINLSVATANFGGISTGSLFGFDYIGRVSPDAARRQVEGGARAMVLDIWPDPADETRPVVCAMVDTTKWWAENFWRNTGGLDSGVGRYSNWKLLSQNVAPAGDIIQSAVSSAFETVSPQRRDPFFLILNLHGAMTPAYLNRLADTLEKAISGRAMKPEYSQGRADVTNLPVSEFMERVCVIVIPDIQSGYNSLPAANTYSSFLKGFMTTKMGQMTNVIEQQPNTISFEPSGASAVGATTAGSDKTMGEKYMVLIQPSIGGQTTDNGELYTDTSYTRCIQLGAQFVALNLLRSGTDGPLGSYFSDTYFGKYSFVRKGAPTGAGARAGAGRR
jgi:hypothetical protein